jgi:RimJ/RimL family protein N-acetyltransferase
MIGDRDYWSKGYGTDVIRTALAHIFTDTKLERVYLHTLSHNLRAQKSFTKAGFTPLREVKRDGYEFMLMEIWRAEWEATNPELKISNTTEAPKSSATSVSQADADPLLGS